MVAMFEIAFLILLLAVGVWMVRRTNLYRNQRRSTVDRVQDSHGSGGRVDGVPTWAPPPDSGG